MATCLEMLDIIVVSRWHQCHTIDQSGFEEGVDESLNGMIIAGQVSDGVDQLLIDVEVGS
jgi:hypothetical protein